MQNFTIKPHRSWRTRTLLLLVLIMLPPLLLLIFLGRVEVDWKLIWPRSLNGQASPEELLAENARLKEQLLALEQNSQVDKQAAALLQQELLESQEQNFRLRRDLEFYQGVMDVKSDKNSPVIQGVRIKPMAQNNGYRLELILLHITNKDKLFEGVLDIVLAGVQDGEAMRLPLRAVSLDHNKDYAVRFRNFQRFENTFVLPDEFRPQNIVVTVSISGQEEGKLEKIFDWPITDGEAENVG